MIKKESFLPFPSNDLNLNKRDFLIIGKAPGQKSLDRHLYFNDTRNKFRELWNVEGLRGNEEKQIKFLKSNGIIIWDRMKIFLATNDKSMDKDRKGYAYNDIKGLIKSREHYNKEYKYPIVILLGMSTIKKCMEEGNPAFINFIDNNKEYHIDGEGSNLSKKEILKLVIEEKKKILINECKYDKNFKPFWLAACYDTSGSLPIKFEDKLKDRKRSGLKCLRN